MKTETFVCGICDAEFTRPLVRGSKPKWCPACREQKYEAGKKCEACGGGPVRTRERSCSRLCGVFIRNGHWPMCAVPTNHPSRVRIVPEKWPALPVFHGDCGECERPFVSNTPVKMYCSDTCAKRVQRRARRGREFGEGDTYRWPQVMALFMAFGRCCAYCRKPVDGLPDPDHVVALSRGGHNTISNILPACRECNCDKQNLTLEEWAADRVRRGKHPVVTMWDLGDKRYTHLALRPALARVG